jgi:HSP20 family protein
MADKPKAITRREERSIEPRESETMMRTPFSFMRRMMDDMDRLFGEFAMGGMEMANYWPEVEMLERGGNLLVRADLPGLTKDDVRVHITGDALVIEGERKKESEGEERGIYHSERSYGSFERRIPLPPGIDANTCDATFDNGVLEVKLKLPQTTKRAINVRGSSPKQEPAQQQISQQTQVQNGPHSPPARH